MIDYTTLCEFEDALSRESTNNSSLLLTNLERRIEYKRNENELETPNPNHDNKPLKDVLFDTFKQYDITKDEFATCIKCGSLLSCKENYKKCCKQVSEQQFSVGSRLEESFWLAFLQNPTSTVNTFPLCTEFLCLKNCIPNPIRSLIWNKLFLLDSSEPPQSSKLIFKNFQHSYNSEISQQIAKDLNRTFPNVNFFNQQRTVADLSTILNVFANYDVELGYCQGLIFLVGVLYYHLEQDNELVFYALVNVMETEPELHDIFTTSTMADTLSKWNDEFLQMLEQVDPQLHHHLLSFVEPQVFLYQWWLSFMSSHSPDLSIVNRIIDFCMFQGWKTGLLRISLGLLICNKPILMAMTKGDEEVVYQHLLNESKWGNVVNNLDSFFGDLLFSWNSEPIQQVFTDTRIIGEESSVNQVLSPIKSFVTNFSPFKKSRDPKSDRNKPSPDSSTKSVNSFEFTDTESSQDGNSSPFSKASEPSTLFESTDSTIEVSLRMENEALKELLKKAYGMIEPNSREAISLRNEIVKNC